MNIKFGCDSQNGGQTAIVGGKIYKESHPRVVGGFSRKIFFIDDLVVKLDDCHLTFNQSKNEFDLWKKLDTKDRKYFAEVVDGGDVDGSYFWVAQRFVDVTERPATGKAKKLIDLLKKKYSLKDIEPLEPGRNWTLVKNTPVIYDYGFKDERK